MKKNIFHRMVVIGSAVSGLLLATSLLFSTPVTAATCNAFGNQGGCPTVQSLQANGGSATVNWAADMNAQTFASIDGTGASTWGLYMIYGWTTSMWGHWFGGGTKTPILTVSNTDPVRLSGGGSGTDACTTNTIHCTHGRMAARFYQKYGLAGTTTVTLPSSWPAYGPPCMIFGAINPGTGDFLTVYTAGMSEPCQPGHPGTVEPQPDPQWCGMSTSALTYGFGDMSPADVAGKSLSRTATMACSDAGVTYNLYLSNVTTTGRNTLELGRGVKATVSANNQALQTNRTSTGTNNTLNVTVTLSGTPTSTGAISGTGILAVNYN